MLFKLATLASLLSVVAASPIQNSTSTLDRRVNGINLGILNINGDHVAWFSGHPKSDYTDIGPSNVNPCSRTFSLKTSNGGTTGVFQELGCGTSDYRINKNGVYYAQCVGFSEPDAFGIHTQCCANRRPFDAQSEKFAREGRVEMTSKGSAPGEAEAELAQLNRLGFIDAVISEDSDTIVFGALCIIQTSGPYLTDTAQVYTSPAISAHPLCLDDDGLLLFILFVGDDYDRELAHCGPKITTALAQCGFGRDLRRILTTFGGAKLHEALGLWRDALKAELKSNLSGHLDKYYPKLANEVNSSFPNLDVADLYMDPLTSLASRFSGAVPKTSQLKTNLWPGVVSRMLFSRYLIYDTQRKVFATPETNRKLEKIVSQGVVKETTPIAPLTLFQVHISINNFIQKTGLQPGEGRNYVLVTIPQSILASAMRDLSLDLTDPRPN
ncbi:hypothetical protein DFH08DRAFT_996446 [Mycena albidolilacea]|uniref:XPG-I domain-containing protein n=1 Tax=Mycena albidolilacea TaxID=1033008 RepID=A0AAD6YX55_9AGAR|nr:hypothetical protein DFH08DRAFT_996446 [Mycena albidolilacea]